MSNQKNKASVSLIDRTRELEISLLGKYGPLMSTRNVAELLDIKEISVSNGFANNLPWTRPFRGTRIKVGRRVYFNTAEFAEVLRQIQGRDVVKSHDIRASGVVDRGTRTREENWRFKNVRQVQNIFKINRNSLQAAGRIWSRSRSRRCMRRSSGFGLGAFYKNAKVR